MSCGETCFVGKSQRSLVGQPEMQRLIGIEEYSRGAPETRQEPEEGENKRGEVGVALEPLILVFRQRSLSSRIISRAVGKGPVLSG